MQIQQNNRRCPGISKYKAICRSVSLACQLAQNGYDSHSNLIKFSVEINRPRCYTELYVTEIGQYA